MVSSLVQMANRLPFIIKHSGFLPSGVFCDMSIGLVLIPRELSIKGKLADISMFMLLAVLWVMEAIVYELSLIQENV